MLLVHTLRRSPSAEAPAASPTAALPPDVSVQLRRRVHAVLPSLSTATRSVLGPAIGVFFVATLLGGLGLALDRGMLGAAALVLALPLGIVAGLLTGVARLTVRLVKEVPEAVRVGVEVLPEAYEHCAPDSVLDGATAACATAASDSEGPVRASDVVRAVLYGEVWTHVAGCIHERVPVGTRLVEAAARSIFFVTARQVTRDVRRQSARRRLVQSVLYSDETDETGDPHDRWWVTPEAVREALDAGRHAARRQGRRIRWITAAILAFFALLPAAWYVHTYV